MTSGTTSNTVDLTIYKSIPLDSAKNRPMHTLTEAKKAQAKSIVASFISHMKNKHL